MNQQKISETANNLMQYLRENGWNKTLKLIKDMQNRNPESAQAVLTRLEDLITGSKNGDYIYFFARDVEGANLNKLLFCLNELLQNYEFFGPTEEEFKRWAKYEKEISKWAQKRTKPVSANGILSSFDDI